MDWVSQFVALFQDLDGKSVIGALVLALASAAIALVSSAARIVVGALGRFRAERRKRTATFVLFYNAVKVRKKNCESVYSVANRKAYLELIKKSGPTFKGYVVIGTDTNDYNEIRPFLPHLSPALMHLIKSFTDYDQLLDAQYAKIGTEDFRELPRARKIAVAEALYNAAGDVIEIAEQVLAEFRRTHRYIRKLDKQIEPLITRIEEQKS